MTGIKKGTNVYFSFKNLANQARLFSFGFKPVFKTDSPSSIWKRIPGHMEPIVSFLSKYRKKKMSHLHCDLNIFLIMIQMK